MEELPLAPPAEGDSVTALSYTRRQLNGHWVEYTFNNSEGEIRSVAFPRVQIISDEVIAESYREAEGASS